MYNDSDLLIEKLDAFIRKFYKDRLIRGVIYTVGLLVLLFLIIAALEYFNEFGTGVRTALFWSFILATAGVLWSFVIQPITKWLRLGQTISHQQAAEVIGTHFTEVKDKLLNTLQLRDKAQDIPSQSEWIEASISQRSAELSAVPFTQAIDLSKNRRYLKYALPPILLFLVILFAAPSLISESTKRLVEHNVETIPVAPFSFGILNDELLSPEQEDFVLELEMSGDAVPDQVSIVVEGQTVPMVKKDNIHYEHRFRNVQGDQEFHFTANGFNSQAFTLNTLPNPMLLNFSMALDFPAYLGMGNQTLNNTGDVTIPAGTRITWNASTRSADELTLAFQDTTLALKPVANDRFEHTQRFMSGVSYSIAARNEFMDSKNPLGYRIDVVPDLHPSITAEQEPDTTRPKVLYFQGSIEDDHGFRNLKFHYRYTEGGDTLREDERVGSVDINFDRSSNSQRFYHVWNMYELSISPGDKLEYWFEVWDNDGVNGSKSARTRVQSYNAPSREELSDLQDERAEAMKSNLEQGIKEAQELQKELDKLRRELIEKKETDWQDKQKLQDILDKQQKLEQRIDQMSNDLQNSQEQMRESRQLDERLLEKQQQLQQLFNDVMSEEMKKLYQDIQEMMEKLDKDKLQEQLEEMEMDQESIEKELDRSLEMFKQLEVEEKALDIAEQLDQLSDEQEKLAEETKEGKTPQEELQEKQEELNEKFDKLKEEMQELEEKNEALEDPFDLPNMEEEQEAVDKEQEESSEQLEKEKNDKASESQQNASDQMEQMAGAMQNAMDQESAEQQQENMDDLRQLLENIVQLSFDQEGVIDNMKTLVRKDPRYGEVGLEQRNIRDDARMIEDSLLALSKRVPQLESIVNREMTAINNNMDRAIEEISEARVNVRRKAVATEKQQRAMTSLNNLALLLDEALQQMMQQMAQSQPGSGSCSKPGGNGKGKPSNSKKMKAMQKQLQKQLEKMRDSMKGKKPGGKEKGDSPGMGMPGGMSQSLAEMAAKQAALRKEMQKLSEEMNKDGSGAGNGLKELAKELKEQEKDIVNKRIDQKTINRQKDIMTRLLEHEKAEREREFDNKRKSKEGQQNLGEDPVRFFEYQQRKEREAELLRTVPPALKPYYKDRVNKYFGTFERP